MTGSTTALAVITARNEAQFLQVLIPELIAEGFELVIIDHASRDETRSIAEEYLGAGVLEVVSQQWTGHFSLSRQLSKKADVMQRYAHSWLAHCDADEWPRSTSHATLGALLADLEGGPYRVVNFDEFVFVPHLGFDALGTDFRHTLTGYYFFEPAPARLQRIWHRSLGFDIATASGHQVTADTSLIWPDAQQLRHYVGLSQSAAITKRANRDYPDEEIALGWHHNRLTMTSTPFERSDHLRRAEPWDCRHLDRSQPWRTHFWQ